MSKVLVIRAVGVILIVLGVWLLGEIAWQQLIVERDASVRSIYPMTAYMRGVAYVVGGVGLVALRKWALPVTLSIVAMCRGIDIYDAWVWVSIDGAPMWRLPKGELILCAALFAVCVWAWSAMRWKSKISCSRTR